MLLEDYFEFETFDTQFGAAERIRIKGHRIAIEHVIHRFKEGIQPDVIVRDHYPTLTLEEVYATITYYLHNRDAVEAYEARGERVAEAFYQEHLRKEPDPLTLRLRALAAERRRQGASADG